MADDKNADSHDSTRRFILQSILSKLIGDAAILAPMAIVLLFSVFEDVWTRIPLMERFAFIPWLLFVYTYGLCSMYENAQSMSRKDRTIRRKNYHYTLYWGLLAFFLHYMYIPFGIKPGWIDTPIGSSLFDFFNAIQGINNWISNSPVGNLSPSIEWVGLLLSLYGASKAGSGRIHLNGFWGVHVYNYKGNHRLVKNGPYKHVRHPIYGGQIMLVFGTALVAGDIVFYIFTFLTIFMNVRRAVAEEEELKEMFGDEFEEYRKNTKFMYLGFT